MFDVIVIGAGVSGLIASGKLSERGAKVLLLEKMEKPARKLRITGKGRCNITNNAPIETHLEKLKTDAEFARHALKNFDSEQVINFFNTIGAPTKVERGSRVFPVSESAVDLALRFVEWAENEGVTIKCHAEVTNIQKLEDGNFEVACIDEKYISKNVVITTGGASYPSTGSTGDGYNFAYELGHNIIPVRPSLVPLVIENCDIQEGLQLKNTEIKILINNELADSRFGDVEFTDRGLAGAAVLQISRLAVDAIGDKKKVIAMLDLKSALNPQKLTGRIERELEQLQSATVKVLLQKLTPSALHKEISKQANIALTKKLNSLNINDIGAIVHTLKNLKISIIDYRPFKEAIVTAGGVDTSEVESTTMESKIVKGLYFAGEVLDMDADTGGFNIQLALSTGALVANSIEL